MQFSTVEKRDPTPSQDQKITRAIARAQVLIHGDAAAVVDALKRAGLSAPTPAHFETIVGLYRPAVPKTPQVSAAAIERNAMLYPARPSMPDFAKIRAGDFVAPSFAEAASAIK